jgi:hypothetical protein
MIILFIKSAYIQGCGGEIRTAIHNSFHMRPSHFAFSVLPVVTSTNVRRIVTNSVNPKATFTIEFLNMGMKYHHTKFHIPQL